MADWKWFIGFAPSIGWDMAFQAQSDLLERLAANDAPERLRIRRPSKLEVGPGPDKQPLMRCSPWVPKYFSAIGKDGEGIVARQLFLWIVEATPGAAEDWDREWDRDGSVLVVEGANEAAIAHEAKARQEMARAVKGGPLRKV
jgi:hypothetical protein